MSHASELTGLALVILAAVLCGVLLSRFRQPAIVGYILAGILLGPTAFGVVESREKIEFLAELGVLLLLFLIGLELPISQIRLLWRRVGIVVLCQIAAGVGSSWVFSWFFGWSTGMSVLLGFVVALSSTAVVTKILLENNLIDSPPGKVTLGVLIAQDLAFVPMILVIPALSDGGWEVTRFWPSLLSVLILSCFILYLSQRERRGAVIRLPLSRLVAGHPDLTPLRGLAWCFGGATLAGVAGLTPAYGAFLAGIGIGASSEREALQKAVQPIESVLVMVFFLSIGLLIDFDFIFDNLGAVLSVLFLVVVFKTAVNIILLRLVGEPWPHALIVGILLAQIGEFSFVLGQTGLSVGLISDDVFRLILSVAALSLAITPLWMLVARRLLRLVIVGVTSGPEVVRAIFGGFSPQMMALWHWLCWVNPLRKKHSQTMRETEKETAQRSGKKGRKNPQNHASES